MVDTEDSTQKTQICDDETNLIHLPHDPHLVTSDPPTITIKLGDAYLDLIHKIKKEFNHTVSIRLSTITEDSVHVIKASMEYLATYTQSLAWSTSKRLSNIEDSQAVMASDLSVMKTNIKTSF
ncbi:hypothetical protein Tco_1400055 [Tanacetum coccineum]